MELIYPVNLMNYDDETSSGDILTRYGEYLGVWQALGGDLEGWLQFVPDGSEEAILTRPTLGLFTMAVRDWLEAQDGDQLTD